MAGEKGCRRHPLRRAMKKRRCPASGQGLLTERTPAVQPSRRERVKVPLSGHLPPPQSKPLSRGVGGQAETSVFRARKGTPKRVEHPSVNGRISFRRFGAKPDKNFVDPQAAMPSSWKTPCMASCKVFFVERDEVDDVLAKALVTADAATHARLEHAKTQLEAASKQRTAALRDAGLAAQAAFGDEFAAELRRVLFNRTLYRTKVNPAIARMVRPKSGSRGTLTPRVHTILTYNFDDLLETRCGRPGTSTKCFCPRAARPRASAWASPSVTATGRAPSTSTTSTGSARTRAGHTSPHRSTIST